MQYLILFLTTKSENEASNNTTAVLHFCVDSRLINNNISGNYTVCYRHHHNKINSCPHQAVTEDVLGLLLPKLGYTPKVHHNQGRNYRPYRPCHAGGPRTPGTQAGCLQNIFFTVRPCSISGIYGFALFDEFVGTDPLDRARFAHNVLDLLACWHMIF